MRILFFISLVFLSACAGKQPEPAPQQIVYIHDDLQSLEEICRSLEIFAVEAGVAKIDKNGYTKELINETRQTEINYIVKTDMIYLIEMINTLPIKTYDDVDAFAYLVYKNCMEKENG